MASGHPSVPPPLSHTETESLDIFIGTFVTHFIAVKFSEVKFLPGSKYFLEQCKQ